MYLKQIIILSVFEVVILAPDITSAFEIISTTTERDVNKDSRCQQEIIKSFRNTLQEQQNFWISFYNDSCESRQTRKEQLFAKKLEEVNAEFGKKQKELIEIVNKQNNLLQHFAQKLEKIEAKFASVQVEEKSTSSLGKVEHGKKSLPRNCLEIRESDATLSDGVYTIQPSRHSPSFEVRCDIHTRDGGWTYVLNRFDGSQDFYFGWQHYKNGFGNLSGEFWLGLQHLYELTGFQDNQLLIEIVDWDNKHYHAMYNVFRIGSAEDGYLIKGLEGYSGDAGDSLINQKNMKFSTYDRDQDNSAGNCAASYHGAWWYNNCHESNLAGTYLNTTNENAQGMTWYQLRKKHISFKEAKMMVRPYYLY